MNYFVNDCLPVLKKKAAIEAAKSNKYNRIYGYDSCGHMNTLDSLGRELWNRDDKFTKIGE